MTAKQLIFILLTLTLLFLAVISISVWLYKFKPEFLAFKPRVIVVDTNAVEKIDTLALKLDSTIKVVQTVSSQRDSAQMTIRMRNDSISFVNKRLDSALNAARTNERLKEDAERNSGLRIDSLSEANFLTFAKIYDDSAPPNVAAILKNILRIYGSRTCRSHAESWRTNNAVNSTPEPTDTKHTDGCTFSKNNRKQITLKWTIHK
jgi:hypothetical protein